MLLLLNLHSQGLWRASTLHPPILYDSIHVQRAIHCSTYPAVADSGGGDGGVNKHCFAFHADDDPLTRTRLNQYLLDYYDSLNLITTGGVFTHSTTCWIVYERASG